MAEPPPANIRSAPMRLHGRLSMLTGWRRNFALFFLGASATLALPPFFAFPLLVPAFCGLYWLAEAAPTHRRAAWDGWWWGWGHFITGLYWFCIALLTDPARYGWMLPFALFGLNAVIALYPACAVLLWRRLRLRGAAGVWLFAVVWAAVEFARGHLFTGFPWNLAGYSWAGLDAAAQINAVTGIYGLTLVTVLLALAPAMCAYGVRMRGVAALWVAFALCVGAGQWRLMEADAQEGERFVSGVRLRMVQPHIAQHHKWHPERQMQGLQTQIDLSRSPGFERATHVIWAETAVPYVLSEGSPLLPLIARAAPEGGALVTGALRSEGEGTERWRLWNSLVAVDARGAITAAYDKRRLVPFGEFTPFRALVPVAAERLLAGAKDFSSGEGAAGFIIPGAPEAGALICYEAIFPASAQRVGKGESWLLNVTNDAWFGLSSGPHQHYHMARMRAVEQGLPLIRVANTGISAVTDAYGRPIAYLRLGTQGVLDSLLPRALPPTIYGRNGETVYILLSIVIVLTSVIVNRRLRFSLENAPTRSINSGV